MTYYLRLLEGVMRVCPVERREKVMRYFIGAVEGMRKGKKKENYDIK